MQHQDILPRTMASQSAHRGQWIVFAILALTMLATRYHHFGNALHLADTSWAAFFLAGLLLPQRWTLPALLLLATGIDIFALKTDGNLVGGCLTAAYPGLLLAYVAMWFTGRMAGRAGSAAYLGPQGLIATSGWMVLGVVATFAISNLTYWAWSGSFGSLSLADYSQRVMPYLANYLSISAGYVAMALIAAFVLGHWSKATTQAKPAKPA